MNENYNLFGVDSFDFVNYYIKQILYPIPQTSKEQIKKLNKIDNTKIFHIIHNNLKICVCEIYPKSKNIKKILIFTHGNGCDIYTFHSYLKNLSENLDDVLVVSWDYPQYGLSEGILDEHTCYKALELVISHYIKITNKILLIGQSLGTGVVVDYVSKIKNYWKNPIILISPYKSIPKIITNLNFFENLICKNKFSTYKKITNTTCPIKIFHGESDEIIDISHSYELYNLIPNKYIKPTWYKNISHNDILNEIKINDYNEILNLI
jgi:pimeloyl-ACP methyl ester carboxylesterase